MRMEEWRQIGGGLQTIRKMRMDARQHWKWNQTGNTETLACHFLPRYYMDLGHPSRLPYGSLRSAWTGPGRDPRGNYKYEKMAGSVLALLVRLPLVGTEHPAVTCT
jgi:hypothetical protein